MTGGESSQMLSLLSGEGEVEPASRRAPSEVRATSAGSKSGVGKDLVCDHRLHRDRTARGEVRGQSPRFEHRKVFRCRHDNNARMDGVGDD